MTKKLLLITFMVFLLGVLQVNSCIAGDAVIQALEIPQDQLLPMQQLLDVYCQGSNIKYTIYYGKKPKFVLVGDSDSIDKLVELLEKLGQQIVHKDLIYITASLEEAHVSESVDAGMAVGDITVDANYSNGNNNPYSSNNANWNVNVSDGTTALLVGKLKSGNGDSNILVAGQLTTTNGIRGELRSIESIPYPTVNANGSVEVNYQDASTILNVTPVIVEYDAEHPEKSYVKLDIDMTVSSISSSTTSAGTQPQVSERVLNTTRIIRADNQSYIVATMIRDQDAKSNQGIPFLRSIPLLKYLFSEDIIVDERVAAYLKIAVRFVAQTDAGKEDYVKSIKPSAKTGVTNAH